MTETEISKFVAALGAENDMLTSDRERQFDGSSAWKELTHRMELEVLQLCQATDRLVDDQTNPPQ